LDWALSSTYGFLFPNLSCFVAKEKNESLLSLDTSDERLHCEVHQNWAGNRVPVLYKEGWIEFICLLK
jgi:hypothetical protein